MSTKATAEDALAWIAARDREEFARDARAAAELLTHIADNPGRSGIGSDLSRLSQQVAELVRRAAKISATEEASALLKAEAEAQ
ncbi:hypothetical protein AB0K92_15840 [Streptomyces sp. NPDC052687]|uniref:hypothetical protein n=1 Tax=Streptomyces sp. NPDC052687 TaxID=3154759 RepID=UPI003441761A